MIELITNSGTSSHLKALEAILKDADEVCISVAFLKMSGVSKLERYFKKKIKFSIITGANFGITEPEALRLLLAYSERYHVQGYLNNLKSKVNFHPKMYLVRSGTIGHIIIGSANLTSGGLETNAEVSLHHRCSVSDPVWLSASRHFDTCILPQHADLLNERIISIYRKFHKKQKAAAKDVEQFPDVADNLFYDFEQLKSRYDALDKTSLEKEYKEKADHYKEALRILDRIAGKPHSPKEFQAMLEDLVGKAKVPGLWYSNGMYRHKGAIFKQQEAFRKLIKSIKSNIKLSPALVYAEAKLITDQIKGAGPNFIGEIMMTYAPDKLANINRNPITVLTRDANADLKDHSRRYTGIDYEQYNDIVKEIYLKLGLKDMLQADSFFNRIYKKITR
jgi:HKD family nuclease